VNLHERYTAETVASGIGLDSFADDRELREADRAARVLFRPAFHPECALTAVEVDGLTTVSLHTARTNLWYWWGSLEETSASRPSPPVLWRDSADAALEQAHAFWSEIEALEFDSTGSEMLGVDGMTVNGVLFAGETTAEFETWSPDPPTPEHRFAAALWSLADSCLREDVTVRLLEQLHRYLGLGAPVKLARGPFTTVRLFGGLSTHDESTLRATFGEVTPNEPLLMDLSNVDGMGTLLHEVFSAVAKRPGVTAWIASEGALPHVQAIGVPPSTVFADRDQAEAWLAEVTS
jgi:hypothetical protein